VLSFEIVEFVSLVTILTSPDPVSISPPLLIHPNFIFPPELNNFLINFNTLTSYSKIISNIRLSLDFRSDLVERKLISPEPSVIF